MKSMKKFGNNLNIWDKSYFYKWYFPCNWGRTIKTFFRHIKYSHQRIKYGFCAMDTWNLDTYLTYLLANSIEYLAENSYGYPGTGENGSTPEAWEAYLKDISILLRRSLENEYYHNKYEEELTNTFDKATFEKTEDGNYRLNWNRTPEEEELSNNWAAEEKIISELRRQDLEAALDMIKENWWNLWD